MASSAHISKLLASFLINLIFHPALGDPATQQWIDQICRQLEEYGYCNKTLNENLRGPTDYIGLTKIASGQALKNATHTYQFISQLFNGTTDPPTKTALEDCRIGHSIVCQVFQQANFYFNQGDYSNMVQVERAAPKAQANCRPLKPESPLVERNRKMRMLIAMAAVTGHQLAP